MSVAAPASVVPGDELVAIQAHALAAQRDGAAFTSLVLRDERTGGPVELAPMHYEWHDLAEKHDRLLILSHVEAGKTNALSVARVLFELGRNPGARIALVSSTAGQAEKMLAAVAQYIKRSEELRWVFPNLQAADPWTTTALTVARPHISKDFSVQAFGVHGNVLGARLDLIVLDDVVDFENTRTADQREKLWAWYQSTLAGRLTAAGRVIAVGTAYHPDDLLHRLARQPGWHAVRHGVTNDDGTPRWPARWNAERIEQKRVELGPLEAARQLDCMARSEADARFKEEWIRVALDRGRGKTLLPHIAHVPSGVRTITGVDLAVSAKSSADLTVFFTIAVHPNGDRELLSIEAGRWAGPEIVERIVRTHRRFHSTIIVESNAAQAYIGQMVRHSSAVPVVSYTTGRGQSSLEWQCEALATEMANGKWILPSEDGGVAAGEVASLTRDLLYYDPRSHCPDRVAAACFARWGAQQGENRVQSFYIDLFSR